MKASRKLIYLACFVALALTAALAIDRIGRPSMAPLLARAVIVAALAGAPGLLHRRAWPVGLVLLPLGAYLVLRTQLPLPASVHGAGQQYSFYLGRLNSAADAYARQRFPFDLRSAADLKLLVSLVTYAATGMAAFVALSLRKALPAAVIFLVLLGFGLTVDGAGRVFSLPLAYLFLAGCLLALSRSLQRERWRPADALAGAATAVISSLLALFLLGATSVAASPPWQDWRAWGPFGTEAPYLAFNWMENYPRLLDPQTDAQVMRVKSPVASYWRANALDHFSGIAWLGGSRGSPLEAEGTGSSYTYAVPGGDPEPTGKSVTEVFEVQSLYTDYFFTAGTPRALAFALEVPVFVTTVQALRVDRPLGPKLEYELEAVIPRVKPADLVGRGRDYPQDVRLRYTAMPFLTLADMTGSSAGSDWQHAMGERPADREWLGLYQLNREIVGGASDPYEITLRVERYLRSNYTYSLTPPLTGFSSPYAAFLFETRTGYCQHFAGAMAALLRFNGIPARVAVGFTTGERMNGDVFVVSRNDAHAWVEVYFPRVGWLPFDPTPGQNIPGPGPSSTSAGFVDPFAQGGGAGGSDTLAPDQGSLPREPAADGEGGASGTADASAGTPRWLPWTLALAAAVLAWPFGRAVVRRRGLRRGSLEERLQASLALVYADLRDHGVTVPRSQTLEETSRFLKQHLGLDATSLADRIQAVLFGGRSATAEDLADVATLRRELRRRLRARRGWVRGALACYGLRVAAP